MKKNRLLPISLLSVALLIAPSLIPVTATVGASAEQGLWTGSPVMLASFSDEISVHAARRGNPWINLSDGRELLTGYVGDSETVSALQDDRARGLSLASDDFDGDGTADLVCGYQAADGTGIIVLHRGNVDSIYPNSPEAQIRRKRGEATDAPFLAPARVFELPAPAEFLGAGDFDADGHRDVVAASSTDEALYFMRGDGQGWLGEAERIELPGRVTAMTVGEINRQDGLADIVVAVNGFNGPQALVFEGPHGAMRSEPDVIILPAEATSLAIGQLDDSYEYDLAIATGSELLVVKGRDRKLLWKELLGTAEVESATMSRKQFPFSIAALAIGEFVADGVYSPDIAVLSEDGRVQYLRRGDAGTREVGYEWEVMNEVRVAEIAPRSDTTSRRVMAKVKVSSRGTDDLVVIDGMSSQLQVVSGGPGSKRALHEMISLDMDGEAAAVLPMRLNRGGLSDLVILKANSSALTVIKVKPMATFLVTNTNNTGPGSLHQAIIDANESPGADAILFSIDAGAQTIRPVIGLRTVSETVTIDATSQPGFSGTPIIQLIGSISADAGLVISAESSVVRGLVINSFFRVGIELSGARNSTIEGNLIGINLNGAIRGNRKQGVIVRQGAGNTIQNNLISGNLLPGDFEGHGIRIDRSTENIVQANRIGTDMSGSHQIPNNVGVEIRESANNTVGGLLLVGGLQNGNLISGNVKSGIDILSGSQGNLVQGNLIGTDNLGGGELPNQIVGVTVLQSSDNMIGSSSLTRRNIISGNGRRGVEIFTTTGTQLINNIIGADISGEVPVPNFFEGVLLSSDASGNLITRNTIAFNRTGVAAKPNAFIGNFITANSIHSNRFLGIDLGSDAVTPNDGPGDRDDGPNLLQNFPILTAVKDASGECKIKGVLESAPNTIFRIEFFANRERDPSGHGEGETFLGFTMVTTDPNGRAEFETDIPADAAPLISATATDPAGNTSEFSPIILRCADSTVTTTANDGPGSFRIALQGGGVIEFNIPQSDPGFDPNTGTWKMLPQTPLPPVNRQTFIYGSSQPGSDPARPPIIIDGRGNTPNGIIFGSGSDGSILEGIELRGFQGLGAAILGAQRIGIFNSLFTNNRIGLALLGASFNTLSNINSSNNSQIGLVIANQGQFQGGESNLVLQSIFCENGLEGMTIIDSASNFIFGGEIKKNGDGVSTKGPQSSGNIFSNVLFADNTGAGAGFANGASDNEVRDSIFLRNGVAGITSQTGTPGNRFRRNLGFRNVQGGIDLGLDGQQGTGAPTLMSAEQTNSTRIQGTFRGRPNADYIVDFFTNTSCHSSGFGEGQFFTDTVIVTTDSSGNAAIDVTLDATVPAGQFITATATGDVEGTSEFSGCVQVTGNARPDVALTKSGPASIPPGQVVTYTLEAKNIGQATAFGVTITDDLPACLTNIFCTTSQGDCTIRGNRVIASLGGIDVEGVATVTIFARVNESCGQGLTNTARVEAASDTNAANDTSTVNTPIRPGPRITSLRLKGTSKLIVMGEGFQPGAKIIVRKPDGTEMQINKTKFNSETRLTGKKVEIAPGDRVVVENPGGTRSNDVVFAASGL